MRKKKKLQWWGKSISLYISLYTASSSTTVVWILSLAAGLEKLPQTAFADF